MTLRDAMKRGQENRLLTAGGLVVGAAVSLLYLYFFAMQAYVTFDIQLFEPKRSWFSIYWADDKTGYTETRKQQVLISNKDQKYSLFIGNLDDIRKLRIDPVEFDTKLFLRNFKITQQGFKTIELSPANRFEGLEPVKQVEGVRYKEDGLRFLTTGRDPQLELTLNPESIGSVPVAHILIVLSIMGLCMVGTRVLGGLGKRYGYVPVLLLVAISLALIMAVISRDYWLAGNGVSRIFVHPDEEAHSTAIAHYREHWLPPAVDDPAIADSYSIYGYSRLASYELYYPIAGYFTRLLQPLHNTLIWDARLFGVLLFALVGWLAWRREHFRPIALPLLLSAQVWYLFSYANSDGFALVLAIIIAWQFAWEDSPLNRLLRERDPPRLWFNIAWLGLLAGALFLLKLNFYFFILFLGAYVLWKWVGGDYPDWKLFLKRLTIIGLVGMAVYGGRYAVDHAVNGPDPEARRLAMVEQMAQPLYKPSTALNKKHIYLFMRDRGVSLKRMIKRERWFGKTFVSSFGAYGYTQYLGGRVYYELVKWTGIALFGVMLLGILIYGSRRLHWLFTITAGSVGLLLAASFWQSWTISFQAQGRYLAPMLPMLGVLFYHSRRAFEGRLVGIVMHALILMLFALAVYSFVIIGLSQIPKFA